MATKINLTAIFSYAFRPLFLCAFGSAILFVAWWILAYLGFINFPPLAMPALYWHSHEMLFGFVGAAIGGFLLTAIANWTGRPPLSGLPLILLTLCWLSGRVAMACSGLLPYGLVAVVDMSYLSLLIVLAWREIAAVENKRNYKIIFILAMLALANLTYHFGLYGKSSPDLAITNAAIRATILIVSLLIAIIGGRIIPNFTRNWLNHQLRANTALPPSFKLLDKVTLLLTLILLPLWVGLPQAQITGIWAIVTGVAHAIRLSRWRGLATTQEPLLFVLHLGYSWLAIGFTLLGLSILTEQVQSPAVHALSVGAMMTMILAVAARAALGHTNRALTSSPKLTLCFVLITFSAIVRVSAGFTPFYGQLLAASAVLNLLALCLFCWIYMPLLLQPGIPKKQP